MKDKLDVEKINGTGTPLVFVHGWLGSKDSWNQVRDELNLENPKIFYSQRCHGNSECSEFRLNDLADDLEEITRDLGDPVIVGHSMGGMTALKYSTISDNFSGLILLGTCASTPRPNYRSPQYFLDMLGDIAREKWAGLIADNYAEGTEEMRRESFQELLEADIEPVKYGLKAMIDYDVIDQLEEENAVVVAGKDDGAIKPEQSRDVSELLNCEFRLIDSSHLMLQEKPEKVAEIIQEFVENQ
ncbi:MAG: alpha/beta fold hydrolase [Candidatus Nanosalina sp.]